MLNFYVLTWTNPLCTGQRSIADHFTSVLVVGVVLLMWRTIAFRLLPVVEQEYWGYWVNAIALSTPSLRKRESISEWVKMSGTCVNCGIELKKTFHTCLCFYIFFVQTFAANVKAELQKFPEDDRDDVVILFSAHSLPLKVSVSRPCVTGWQTDVWFYLIGSQSWRPLPTRGRSNRSECDGLHRTHSSLQTGLAIQGNNSPTHSSTNPLIHSFTHSITHSSPLIYHPLHSSTTHSLYHPCTVITSCFHPGRSLALAQPSNRRGHRIAF